MVIPRSQRPKLLLRQMRVKRIGPTFDLTHICLIPSWLLKLRRPLFGGSPRLGDCSPMSFCQLAVIAIQLAAYAFMSLEGPKTRGSALQVLKSFQNRPESCCLELRGHPATPMVIQGGPEVLKWLANVFPRCQNCLARWSEMTKWLPECQKGGTEGPK